MFTDCWVNRPQIKTKMDQTKEKLFMGEDAIRAKMETARKKQLEDKKRRVSKRNATYYAKTRPSKKNQLLQKSKEKGTRELKKPGSTADVNIGGRHSNAATAQSGSNGTLPSSGHVPAGVGDSNASSSRRKSGGVSGEVERHADSGSNGDGTGTGVATFDEAAVRERLQQNRTREDRKKRMEKQHHFVHHPKIFFGMFMARLNQRKSLPRCWHRLMTM